LKFSTLQTGGCHSDKWIVPSERNRPDFIRQDLIDWQSITLLQDNSKKIIGLLNGTLRLGYICKLAGRT
jgi:hypothetical protein